MTNFSSFQCWFCERNLLEHRYLIHDGFACCLNCFQDKFSSYCSQCQQIIAIDMPARSFHQKIWHDSCFNCSICTRSLIDRTFAYEDEKLLCRNCFIEQFAQRCSRCNRTIEPSEKCLRYDEKFYHQSCFVCHICQQPLMTNDFRRRGDEYLICLSCHRQFVAIYCIKCHQAIVNDGVLYRNHPFHSECFLCTNCGQSLRNERFFQLAQQAFCSTCAEQLFR